LLVRRTQRQERPGKLTAALPVEASYNLNRRDFLRYSGLSAGTLAAAGTLSLGSVGKAEADPPPSPSVKVTTRKNLARNSRSAAQHYRDAVQRCDPRSHLYRYARKEGAFEAMGAGEIDFNCHVAARGRRMN
jgi:hypothetical protein